MTTITRRMTTMIKYDKDHNTNICKMHNVSSKTESNMHVVTKCTALAKYRQMHFYSMRHNTDYAVNNTQSSQFQYSCSHCCSIKNTAALSKHINTEVQAHIHPEYIKYFLAISHLTHNANAMKMEREYQYTHTHL